MSNDLPQIPTISFHDSPSDPVPSPASTATMPTVVPQSSTPKKIDQPTPAAVAPSIEEDLPLSEVVTALKSSAVPTPQSVVPPVSPQPTPVQVPPPKADLPPVAISPQSVTSPTMDQPPAPPVPSTKSPLYEDPDKVKTIGG